VKASYQQITSAADMAVKKRAEMVYFYLEYLILDKCGMGNVHG